LYEEKYKNALRSTKTEGSSGIHLWLNADKVARQFKQVNKFKEVAENADSTTTLGSRLQIFSFSSLYCGAIGYKVALF
jgi:hypothetical protein